MNNHRAFFVAAKAGRRLSGDARLARTTSPGAERGNQELYPTRSATFRSFSFTGKADLYPPFAFAFDIRFARHASTRLSLSYAPSLVACRHSLLLSTGRLLFIDHHARRSGRNLWLSLPGQCRSLASLMGGKGFGVPLRALMLQWRCWKCWWLILYLSRIRDGCLCQAIGLRSRDQKMIIAG